MNQTFFEISTQRNSVAATLITQKQRFAKIDKCDGRESNPDQLLGRQLC